jgi:hypothetical protein
MTLHAAAIVVFGVALVALGEGGKLLADGQRFRGALYLLSVPGLILLAFDCAVAA